MTCWPAAECRRGRGGQGADHGGRSVALQPGLPELHARPAALQEPVRPTSSVLCQACSSTGLEGIDTEVVHRQRVLLSSSTHVDTANQCDARPWDLQGAAGGDVPGVPDPRLQLLGGRHRQRPHHRAHTVSQLTWGHCSFLMSCCTQRLPH